MATHPTMNNLIVDMLRLSENPSSLYAADRIEELEDAISELVPYKNLSARAKKHSEELEVLLSKCQNKLDLEKSRTAKYTKGFHYYKNLAQVTEENSDDDESLYTAELDARDSAIDALLSVGNMQEYLLAQADKDLKEARTWAIHYRKIIKAALKFAEDPEIKDTHLRLIYDFLDINLDELP